MNLFTFGELFRCYGLYGSVAIMISIEVFPTLKTATMSSFLKLRPISGIFCVTSECNVFLIPQRREDAESD